MENNDEFSARWTPEETKILITIWGDESVQSKLDGTVRDAYTYKEIKDMLYENGVTRFTLSQIKTKIKNLKKTYRREKDNRQKSGSAFKSSLYEQIGEILGDKIAEVGSPDGCSLLDTDLDISEELVINSSAIKTEEDTSPCFMNFEESYTHKKTKRKKSTDESSSDAGLPSSSEQLVTCSRPSVSRAVDDVTVQGQARSDTHGKDSPDSAFCHYIHTVLTTIPDCFKKEKAKIQITEILMKLKYPQG